MSEHPLSTQCQIPEYPRTRTRLMSNSTPQVSQRTASSDYTSSSSTFVRQRDIVIPDADEIPISKLLESVFPNVTQKIISDALKNVQLQPDIFSQTTWTAFQVPSGKRSEKEELVYRPLKDIFEAVAKCASNSHSSQVQFGVHRDTTSLLDWPNQTHPDGSICLKETSLPYSRQGAIIDHSDICCYIEFKRQDTPYNFTYNCRKLVYNIHHRFHSDPRCRYVFGLTIEDSTTRFWYFSRATITVSEPFDFIKEYHVLVHIFLAFSWSSIEGLDFDTTIKCVDELKPVDEQLPDARSLSNPGEDSHYKGNEDSAQKSHNVRKRSGSEAKRQDRDVDSERWRLSPEQAVSPRVYEITVHTGEHNATEKGQQGGTRTFRTIRCLANCEAIGIRSRGTRVFEVTDIDQPNLRYVLKDVWINKNRNDEGTTLRHLRDRLERECSDALQHFLQLECYGVVLINGEQDVASSIIGRREDPRKHYRIVFKGPPGRPLNHLSIYEAFLALQGGMKAIIAMYKMGYIHRDLSCGNILLVEGEKGPTGVLIDLEYAKRFPDTETSAHDVRTGTREFMAIEVAWQRFVSSERRLKHNIAWFHHPIHEAESIWWIALWIFYYRQESLAAERTALFPDSGEGSRVTIWMVPSQYETRCTRPPEAVRDILYDWQQCIKTVNSSLHARIRDGTHQNFDYSDVLSSSLEYLEQIQAALKKTRDEDESFSGDADRPHKRRRTDLEIDVR